MQIDSFCSCYIFSADTTPDDTIGEAKMYDRQGDPTCPVQSFKKYLTKLHPDIDCLWQRPLETFDQNAAIWYCKIPLGKNTLGSMMADISDVGGLSRRYTNHCIRATSITSLDRAGFEARHIMRASGHKSESSIRSYSKRLTEEKQRTMSDTLGNVLNSTTPSIQPYPELSEHEILSLFQDENMFMELEAPHNSNNTVVSQAQDINNSINTITTPQPPVLQYNNSLYNASTVATPQPSSSVLQNNNSLYNAGTVATPQPSVIQNMLNPVANMSTNNTYLNAPQIFNPMSMSAPRPSYFNINPNISNCTVHFHMK